MPRFTILSHDWPAPHFDLLLEQAGALKTWRLQTLPGETKSITAEMLPDHRMIYLDYEGPVSGDRGTVMQCDSGVYESSSWTESEIHLHLDGTRIKGHFRMSCVAGCRAWVIEACSTPASKL